MILPGRIPLRYIGTAFIFILMMAVQANGTPGDSSITGIDIRPENNEIELTVEGSIEYGYFQLSEPYRLVFDFPGALLENEGGATLIEEVELASFREVRLTQLSLDPLISRLVLYLDEPSSAIVNFNPNEDKLLIEINEGSSARTSLGSSNSGLTDLFSNNQQVTGENSGQGNESTDPMDIFTRPEIPDQIEPLSSYEISSDDSEVNLSFPGLAADNIRVTQLSFPNRLKVRIFTSTIDDSISPRFTQLARGNVWNAVAKQWTSYIDRDGLGIIDLTLYTYPEISYTQAIGIDGTPEVRIFKLSEPVRITEAAIETEMEEITELEVANYPIEVPAETGLVTVIPATETIEVIENAILGVAVDDSSSTTIASALNPAIGSLPAVNFPIRQSNLFNGGYRSTESDDLDMRVGEVVVLRVHDIIRASMGNPVVATINVLSLDEILITALAPGTTTLLIWESDERYTSRMVTVRETTIVHEEDIASVIGDDNISVSIIISGETEGTPGVVLEGTVETEEERARAQMIAGLYAGDRITNLIEVSAPRQVLVKVRVVEVDSRALDEHLSHFSFAARTDDDSFTIGIITDLLDPENPGGGLFDSRTRPGILNGNTQDMVFDPIDAVLNELVVNRQANILSEPNVVGLSGHEVHFRVGGEIPYTYLNQEGINVVEFKEFGISLDMTPYVDSQGNIMLELTPIVRTVDMALAIGGIPGFRTREMTTTVQLRGGETLVIGGLIQSEITEVIAEVPFLSDIPILGELFRSKRFIEDETELVIFLTPFIIDNPGQSGRLIGISPEPIE
jgi:pilus assembly protein CpaC